MRSSTSEPWRQWPETQELTSIVRRLAVMPGGRKLIGIAVQLIRPLLTYKQNRRAG